MIYNLYMDLEIQNQHFEIEIIYVKHFSLQNADSLNYEFNLTNW